MSASRPSRCNNRRSKSSSCATTATAPRHEPRPEPRRYDRNRGPARVASEPSRRHFVVGDVLRHDPRRSRRDDRPLPHRDRPRRRVGDVQPFAGPARALRAHLRPGLDRLALAGQVRRPRRGVRRHALDRARGPPHARRRGGGPPGTPAVHRDPPVGATRRRPHLRRRREPPSGRGDRRRAPAHRAAVRRLRRLRTGLGGGGPRVRRHRRRLRATRHHCTRRHRALLARARHRLRDPRRRRRGRRDRAALAELVVARRMGPAVPSLRRRPVVGPPVDVRLRGGDDRTRVRALGAGAISAPVPSRPAPAPRTPPPGSGHRSRSPAVCNGRRSSVGPARSWCSARCSAGWPAASATS